MREADIRPAELHDEYLRLSAADARSFFSDHGALEHRACPGCGADDPEPAFEKHDFRLSTCRDCGSLYVDPAPGAAQLDRFYRDSPSTRYWANVFFPAVAEARRERIFRPRVERILAMLDGMDVRPRRIVDVGAGAAIFLEEFRDLAPATELRAVEPGNTLAATCRDKGFATFEGFAEDAAGDADWSGWADLATCFEVIEHAGDVRSFVTALSGLVRPGGMVLISGLCGDGFDIQALGARSKAVAPPHHLNFLSRRGVAALLTRCGLEEIAFETPGQLDVDIVCNALKEDPGSVADTALRDRLLSADSGERARLQEEIRADGRSSHMWILARNPPLSAA